MADKQLPESENSNSTRVDDSQSASNRVRRGASRRKTVYIVFLFIVILCLIGISCILFFLDFKKKDVSGNLEDSLSEDAVVEGIRLKDNLKNPRFQEVHDGLRSAAQTLAIDIIEGPFDACASKGWKRNCVDNKLVKGVMDWELGMVASLLTANHVGIDYYEEVDTIIMQKKFNDLNGIHYNNREEYARRYYYFRKHRRGIEEHNRNPERTYDKGYNWAMEYSDSEAGLEMLNMSSGHQTYNYVNGEFLPSEVYSSSSVAGPDDIILKDWRDQNVISPVINQGACGSCWAVAAASLIDSYRAIKTGKLIVHSPKHLLDCTAMGFNCRTGGNHETALQYAANHGICDDSDYPYYPVKNICKEQQFLSRYKIDGIVKLDDRTLEDHVRNHGPALVTMKLSRDFMDYGSGIFDGACVARVAHSILIIGFGVNKKMNHRFWIVKNSWGKHWGHDGYFKLSREAKGEFTRPDTFCHVNKHAFGLKTR